MSFFIMKTIKPQQESHKIGYIGEQKACILLSNLGYKVFQADWIGFKDGEYTLFEIKNKRIFTPPPFFGHGLDIRQILARLDFQEKTGIKCKIIIFEPDSELIYYQQLDILEDGPYFDTKNKIRVYPLESFEIYDN